MSPVRKLALSVMPALALALPLAVTSSADAHPGHHEPFEHHEHFDHHVRFYNHVYVRHFAPERVGVFARPLSVFYRVGPDSPWIVYASYVGLADAQIAAQALQGSGFEIFIR